MENLSWAEGTTKSTFVLLKAEVCCKSLKNCGFRVLFLKLVNYEKGKCI
jgi:hypothetical protein